MSILNVGPEFRFEEFEQPPTLEVEKYELSVSNVASSCLVASQPGGGIFVIEPRLSEYEARLLRDRFRTFAEDWNHPSMNVYDDV